jgi:5-methylcytosine-specific restriction endonuclease McrA
MPKGIYQHKKGQGGKRGRSGVFIRTEKHRNILKESHKNKDYGFKKGHPNIYGFKKGRFVSNESKLKISEALKGRKLSEEIKSKISIASKGKPKLNLRGRKLSLETRRKIGLSQKGKILSEETKKKMSIAKKGLGIGRHLSNEIKKKIKENNPHYWLGKKRKPFTEEHKKKISDSRKKILTDDFRRKLSKRCSGKNGNNWKGGVSKENHLIRNGIEIHLWREAVFSRDNFTCQKTGIRGGVLRAHHIKNFAQYPELRFALDNGITLSKEAHNEFHRIYGRMNNTIEQLEEFLNK